MTKNKLGEVYLNLNKTEKAIEFLEYSYDIIQ